MTTTRRDVVLIVAGEDWNGNTVPRFLRPGYGLYLRGKFGQGFDLSGPHAWMCAECGEPTFAESCIYPITMQRHYADVHGFTPALLPGDGRRAVATTRKPC